MLLLAAMSDWSLAASGPCFLPSENGSLCIFKITSLSRHACERATEIKDHYTIKDRLGHSNSKSKIQIELLALSHLGATSSGRLKNRSSSRAKIQKQLHPNHTELSFFWACLRQYSGRSILRTSNLGPKLKGKSCPAIMTASSSGSKSVSFPLYPIKTTPVPMVVNVSFLNTCRGACYCLISLLLISWRP